MRFDIFTDDTDLCCGLLGYDTTSTLKKNAAGFSEILVTTYQTTRPHNPEDQNLKAQKAFTDEQ
jgi:hypothetical protein